ncbi:MAG: hypothetical protein WCT19_03630 [Candidatus Paceibacterota bacterium]
MGSQDSNVLWNLVKLGETFLKRGYLRIKMVIPSQALILSAIGGYKIERPERSRGASPSTSSGHSILQPLAVGKIGEGVETRRRAS